MRLLRKRERLWNAYYKGWFAARAGRRYPSVDSLVEHSYMVDGYEDGLRGTGGAGRRPAAQGAPGAAGDWMAGGEDSASPDAGGSTARSADASTARSADASSEQEQVADG